MARVRVFIAIVMISVLFPAVLVLFENLVHTASHGYAALRVRSPVAGAVQLKSLATVELNAEETSWVWDRFAALGVARTAPCS